MPDLQHVRTKIIEQTYREVLPAARSPNGTPLFENPCPDCGAPRLSDRRRLGKPCGACSNKRRATHGLVGHPLYKLLQGMRVRCEYPSATNYAYYGGRGIRVCAEWRDDPASFVAWAEANGYRPGLEVDRIDANGDYEPDNCRFVSHAKNSRRRRNARCTEAQAAMASQLLGRGLSVSAAAKEAGIPYMSAWHIAKGNTWRNVA